MSDNLAEKVKSYFTRDNNKKWKCLLCVQDKFIAGQLNNCKDHLWYVHREIANEIGIPPKIRKSAGSNAVTNVPLVKKVKYEVDINEVIREFITLFLDQNLSLSTADNLGKISCISSVLRDFNITMNRSTVTAFIKEGSELAYQMIAEEIKDIIPSIMFDGASRNGRNVFGIGIRYLKDLEIKERNVGVLTQYNRQFGVILASQVKEVLAKIGKTADDIYSSCTDNGKNMVKASELLKAAQKQIHILSLLIDEDAEDEYDALIENIRNSRDDPEDENEEVALEDDENSENMTEVDEDIEETFNCRLENLGRLCSITRCGAHCTQLASSKVTKKYHKQLSEIRKYIQMSDNAEYKHLFVNIKPKLKLDNLTRWCSSYTMVNGLWINKEKCKSITNPVFELRNDTWLFIEEFVAAFCPVYESMQYFQTESITSSDFYVGYLKLQSKLYCLKDGKFKIRSELLAEIESQVPVFLDSESLVANLVLDPRIYWKHDGGPYNHDLLTRGVNNILKLLKRKQEIRRPNNATSSTILTNIPIENRVLNRLLGSDQTNGLDADIEDIKDTLYDFAYLAPRVEEEPTITNRFNLVEFWHKKRHEKKYIVISELAQTILAAPFAQTKVERTFSIFALTLTHLRNNLSCETLNSLLVLRDNKDLIKHMNFIKSTSST